MTLRINDIDKQNWSIDLDKNRFCNTYRNVKVDLCLEYYLSELDFSNRLILSKLRCCNLKLPNNLGRFSIFDNDKNCKLCCIDVLGDEYHYIFICSFFTSDRKKYLNPHFYRQPNSAKMFELYNSRDVMVLINLCKFAQIISLKFTS